jgi:hypothetical protein
VMKRRWERFGVGNKCIAKINKMKTENNSKIRWLDELPSDLYGRVR